jgi:hypothetical protein
MSSVACGEGISEPTVGYMPEGWSLEKGESGGDWDLPVADWLMYKLNDNESVLIYYGEVPKYVSDEYRDDPEGLAVFLFSGGGNVSDTAATMILSGQTVGVVSGNNSDSYYICLACIKGNTLVQVLGSWKEPEQLAEVMALINSISF